jgi:hypothetical protein
MMSPADDESKIAAPIAAVDAVMDPQSVCYNVVKEEAGSVQYCITSHMLCNYLSNALIKGQHSGPPLEEICIGLLPLCQISKLLTLIKHAKITALNSPLEVSAILH